MKKVLFGVFGAILAGLAVAQGADGGASVDFASWFSSPHALAAVVVGLVAVVRKHFVKLDGILVPAMALVLGVVLAFWVASSVTSPETGSCLAYRPVSRPYLR
jgi:hypothetical protein